MLQWAAVDGRLHLDPDGRLLLTRPPLPGEAARLRALAGLAVPEVVADGPELTCTWSPPDPGPLDAAGIAAVLAAAHERGVAHGPLERDHVRVGLLEGWAGGDPAEDVASLGRLLLDEGCSPAVAALARRMVAAEPAARPSMRAVADALAPAPAPAVPPAPARRQVPRWVPAVAAIPVALLAVLADAAAL